MNKIFKKEIKIKDKLGSIETTNIQGMIDDRKQRYSFLINELKKMIKEESYNKIESTKILKEINVNKLYIIDGFKTFNGFLNNYNFVKSSVYKYMKLIIGIEKGTFDYNYYLENGITKCLEILENKDVIKKSKQNPLKPLRFQLKDEKAFEFYNENMKFTSWYLEQVFNNNKNELDKFKEEYENLKTKKKSMRVNM